jgi:hypothetical protein
MKALGKGSIASIVEAGLGIARVVLWALLGLWAAALLAYLIFLALLGAGVLDPSLANFGEDSTLRVSIFGIDGNRIENASWTDWHLIAPGFITVGIVVGGSLIIVTQLRLLFDSFRSGEPFRRENANRLRVIWITMAAIELARYVMMGLVALLLYQARDPTVGAISLTLDGEVVSTWGSILILIVLAEVFREGARLKEEQELTI